MRKLVLVLAIGLLAGACAEGAEPGADTAAAAPTEAASAPDFVLALVDGGLFRLSDEQRPVYMIFWAEW